MFRPALRTSEYDFPLDEHAAPNPQCSGIYGGRDARPSFIEDMHYRFEVIPQVSHHVLPPCAECSLAMHGRIWSGYRCKPHRPTW